MSLRACLASLFLQLHISLKEKTRPDNILEKSSLFTKNKPKQKLTKKKNQTKNPYTKGVDNYFQMIFRDFC